MFTVKNLFPSRSIHKVQVRCLWEFVNMMFNKPDPERIKLVGPDRACAEWVLRNGGAVKWSSGDTISDYNSLPPEGTNKMIIEIDASNAAISHHGFPHLEGCKQIRKIILHNGSYIDDRALKGLSHGKHSLTHVQVSQCADVTDVGVKEIRTLQRLKNLIMFDLQSVKDLNECKSYLNSHLPKCDIQTSQPTQIT